MLPAIFAVVLVLTALGGLLAFFSKSDTDPSWYQKPSTSRQHSELIALGYTDDLTELSKGEAADLIDVLKAQKKA